MSLTQHFISEHPSIKDCLRRGLVNYSALARLICETLGTDRFDAVLMACRRQHAMIKDQMTQEKKVRALLKRAKIRLRNKMMVAIVEKPTDFERVYDLQKRIKRDRGDFHLIEGEEVLTLISNSDYVSDLKEAFRGKIKKVTEDLAQLTMVFDEKIETTPGVVSFIYGLLADNSINVWEEMSCWTDLMVIIEEKDAARAMHVLSLDTVAA
jgi:hypothetical protein